MTATVRLFAGAAEAAGTEVTTTTATSVGHVRDELAERFGEAFARVLAQCSAMVDGERAEPNDDVPSGATIDILPPFAGG